MIKAIDSFLLLNPGSTVSLQLNTVRTKLQNILALLGPAPGGRVKRATGKTVWSLAVSGFLELCLQPIFYKLLFFNTM